MLLPLLPLLGALLLSPSPCGAQYEQYSFRGFPLSELQPLQATYARGMALYEGESWREAARALEAGLRLHRLLRDSEASCGQSCAGAQGPPDPGAEEEDGAAGEPPDWRRELQLFGRVLAKAVCLRKCKSGLAVFQQPYPDKETLAAFQRRDPYQYLHYAHFKCPHHVNWPIVRPKKDLSQVLSTMGVFQMEHNLWDSRNNAV
ncbi:endoplasmic reticulum protein SC65 [Ascaphus truei]|uniref:endoplasmic reticulum protein SC65 n=1 Tax=Ascaphus truei TaxID=8439 RepID=UPI003F594147